MTTTEFFYPLIKYIPQTTLIDISLGSGLTDRAIDLFLQAAEKASFNRYAFLGRNIDPIRVRTDPDLNDYDYRIYLLGNLKAGCELRTDMFVSLLNSGGLPEGCKYIRKVKRFSPSQYGLPYSLFQIKRGNENICIEPEDVLSYYLEKLIDSYINSPCNTEN